MGTPLTKEDIAYTNHDFWWYYIITYRGFDDDKELNLDDAIQGVVDAEKVVPNFVPWYRAFCPMDDADDDGCFENPHFISGDLGGISFAIEFHSWQTVFYINDIYIGNQGGHFEVWFLTVRELLVFDRYDSQFLFLLLLPMVGVEEHEREQMEQLVCEKLKAVTLFAGHEAYIAKCIVNGLVIEGAFTQMEGIGVTNGQNHCVRNVEKYPRYTDDVTAVNQALYNFLTNKRTVSKFNTPIGSIQILFDGRATQFAVHKLEKSEVLFPDIDGRYKLTVAYESDFSRHSISCIVGGADDNVEGSIESGERLAAQAFYQNDIKLTIGVEEDSEYDLDGKRFSPSPDYYDYDASYLENGVQFDILPFTKSRTFVFGVAWICPCTDENEVQTWYGADPGIM